MYTFTEIEQYIAVAALKRVAACYKAFSEVMLEDISSKKIFFY
jgi:hypothetical protein